MTKAEYEAAYRSARKTYPNITRSTMIRLKRTYTSASKRVAEIIKDAERTGKADLTIAAWEQVNRQLSAAATDISNQLYNVVPQSSRTAIDITAKIQEEYLFDAVTAAGATKLITHVGIQNMFIGVNDRVIRSVVNRIYKRGYTFSESCWQAGQYYQAQIKDVISSGIAMGRSSIQIAKDVQVYTAGNKGTLAYRYGPNLFRPKDLDSFRKGKLSKIDWKAVEAKYGASKTKIFKNFMKRIGDKVDYRALRLVRSELYMSLQDAAKAQGQACPACKDLYDWVMEAGREHWDCDCPSIAKNGPYEHDKIPGYPHANCRCDIRPILRDSKEFHADLKKWVNGEPVDYMDKWYHGEYKNAS